MSLNSDCQECMYHKKTWREIKELSSSSSSVVVLPLGTVEQHGPHLPLDTDTYILEKILIESCKKSKRKNSVLILPTIPYGLSHLHVNFPGTISINSDLLNAIIYSIGKAVLTMGFKKLLLISWHGGHYSVMHDVSYKLKSRFKEAIIVYVSIIEMIFDKVKDIVEGPIYHADDLETSLMLALNGRVIMNDAIKDGKTSYLDGYVSLNFRRKSDVKIPVAIDKFSRTGVIGDPTRASKEKGIKILEVITNELSKFLDLLTCL